MSEPTPSVYDPEPMLRALVSHGVHFVVIGGVAANFHGSVHVTFDLDITPDRSLENLERLSAALTDIGAKVRAQGVKPMAFNHDGASLARLDVWNLTTPHGDLDISFTPAGTQGYADLHQHSEVGEVLGAMIEIASLGDIVRSKEAANRPKDHATLPTLRRLLDEQT